MRTGRVPFPPNPRSPIMKKAIQHFDNSGMSNGKIARLAGNYETSLSNWRLGKNTPRVDLLDAALNVIGYRLEIVKMENDDDNNN